MRIIGSGASKDAGHVPLEAVQAGSPGVKAPLLVRLKASRGKDPATVAGRKPSRPRDVIPLETGDFKDF